MTLLLLLLFFEGRGELMPCEVDFRKPGLFMSISTRGFALYRREDVGRQLRQAIGLHWNRFISVIKVRWKCTNVVNLGENTRIISTSMLREISNDERLTIIRSRIMSAEKNVEQSFPVWEQPLRQHCPSSPDLTCSMTSQQPSSKPGRLWGVEFPRCGRSKRVHFGHTVTPPRK